jgi:hypothetical protein
MAVRMAIELYRRSIRCSMFRWRAGTLTRGRQRDRQLDRNIDRETDRQRQREVERDGWIDL